MKITKRTQFQKSISTFNIDIYVNYARPRGQNEPNLAPIFHQRLGKKKLRTQMIRNPERQTDLCFCPARELANLMIILNLRAQFQ